MIVEDELDEEWQTQYWMTDVGINLNYLDEDLEKVLPPTDAWRWPDMRAMEEGDFEKAEQEKGRLE